MLQIDYSKFTGETSCSQVALTRGHPFFRLELRAVLILNLFPENWSTSAL